MKKINVLFVMIQMEMGGSERLVHNLALKLDRDIFSPSIAWFYGERILEEFKGLGVPLYHIPKTKRFDLSTMRTLANIIKYNDIHIVNAHHFMSMFYSFYGSKGKNHGKLIYTEHSEWEIEKISWKWRVLGSYLLNHSDGAVGVNGKVSEAIQNRFRLHPSKVFTIRNGVDLEHLGSRKDKMAMKRGLGIGDDEKIIGIVANLKKIKNHIFLLKGFSELVRARPNTRLLLIGQGFKDDPENSEPELRKFIIENGIKKNVLFLGYRSDIPELLGIMDIFCLVSVKEGLPISLIEAMAAGLPVVGTDVEGIKEVIIPGKNGFLIQLEDIGGLKNSLDKLLTNESLRNQFGRESMSLASRNYSLKCCVEEYQNLFLSVIRKDFLFNHQSPW